MKPMPMKIVGYWKSEYQPHLPDPKTMIDASWDPLERAAVIAHLKRGREKAAWRGMSSCRICGIHNGSTCLTDGVYVWPYGLAHYLEAHNVRLPEAFVQHVMGSG